jgi:hypothetical protein
MWGVLPIGSSFLAILFVWLLVEPRRIPGEPLLVREQQEQEEIAIPVEMQTNVYANRVRS